MLGLAAVPSVLMFVGVLFMPESPRWLVFHGKVDKAKRVLGKIRPWDDVIPELQNIVTDYEEHTRSQLST